jgi:hypothetical protein
MRVRPAQRSSTIRRLTVMHDNSKMIVCAPGLRSQTRLSWLGEVASRHCRRANWLPMLQTAALGSYHHLRNRLNEVVGVQSAHREVLRARMSTTHVTPLALERHGSRLSERGGTCSVVSGRGIIQRAAPRRLPAARCNTAAIERTCCPRARSADHLRTWCERGCCRFLGRV